MKNSKEYSNKVQKLFRALKSCHPKVEKVVYDDPVGAIIFAIISENITNAESHETMKKFNENFVDWNDLRVSLSLEIVEALGSDIAANRKKALLLKETLNWIFTEYGAVNLDSLKKTGKRPARQILEKIEGLSCFVIDYCMLTALQAHTIPLTDTMLKYFRDNKMVHPEADAQEIEGFLVRQISARKGYEFYHLLRITAESGKPCKIKEAKKIKKAKK